MGSRMLYYMIHRCKACYQSVYICDYRVSEMKEILFHMGHTCGVSLPCEHVGLLLQLRLQLLPLFSDSRILFQRGARIPSPLRFLLAFHLFLVDFSSDSPGASLDHQPSG